jgi:hypothetical protein
MSHAEAIRAVAEAKFEPAARATAARTALGSPLVPFHDAGLFEKIRGAGRPGPGAGTRCRLAERLWTIESCADLRSLNEATTNTGPKETST